MTLDIDDFEEFRRLQTALMSFVNDTLDIFPNDDNNPTIYGTFGLEEMLEVNDAFVTDRRRLVTAYIKANPHGLDAADLDEIDVWGTAAVSGEFVAFRQLKAHAIFIPAKGEPTAYGVLGPTEPISDLLSMPAFVTANLMPFRGRIVIDGILRSRGKLTTAGKAAFNSYYKKAKAGPGVQTTLPGAPAPQKRQRLSPAERVAALARRLRDRLAELREHGRTLNHFEEEILGKAEAWAAKNLAKQRAELTELDDEIALLAGAHAQMQMLWNLRAVDSPQAAADAAMADAKGENEDDDEAEDERSGNPFADADDMPGDMSDFLAEAMFAEFMEQTRGVDVDDLTTEQYNTAHAQFRETFDHAHDDNFGAFEKSLLRVGADTSKDNLAAVKTAYRRVARQLHPDQNPDYGEEAKELWDLLTKAKTALDLGAIEDLELHWQVIKGETFASADERRLKGFRDRVEDDLLRVRHTVRNRESHPLWSHRGKSVPAAYRDQLRREIDEDLRDMRAEKRRLQDAIASFRRTPAKKRAASKKQPREKEPAAPAPDPTAQPEFDF